MSDEMSVEIDSVAFEGAMQRLKEGVRRGFIDPTIGTLATQGRLLSKRCQDFTPPRSVAQGKAAVARDLTVIFKPISHTTFTDKGLQKIIKTDDRTAWNAVAINFRGSHNLQNTKAIGFSRGWHDQNRISRGRGPKVKSGIKNGNIGVVTLGPEGKKARDYMKEVQKRVGWARAGWNAGILGLGGNVAQPWISRHGFGDGSVINGASGQNPFVRVINSTSWAKYSGEGNRILRNAVEARARDMESYYLRMMKLASHQAQVAA